MKIKIYLLTSLIIFATFLANAQSPDFLKDLNPSGDGLGADLEFVEMGGDIYFAGNSGANGIEIWKTDGTDVGTVMIKDIRPGGASSEPRLLRRVKNKIIFLARTAAEGEELWVTDGTSGGTLMLKDINTGANDCMIEEIVVMGDTAYFNADNGGSGNEIWISDATPGGTMFVKDIASGGSDSNPQGLTAYNGFVYFVANDGILGYELWRTDGSFINTEYVVNLNPASKSAFTNGNVHMVVFDGKLYFNGNDGTTGAELYETMGDSASTKLLVDLYNGSNPSNPQSFEILGNSLLFVADQNFIGKELYKTNGTDTGTVLIKNIGNGSSGSFIEEIVAGTDWAYFAASDGFSGKELWRTNGTDPGTQKVIDTYNGGSGMIDGDPILAIGDTVFFVTTTPDDGAELWRSDGTFEGTWMLRDIAAGGDSSRPTAMFANDDIFLFSAYDSARGYELWKMCMSYDGAVYPYDSSLACDGEDGQLWLADSAGLNITWYKDSTLFTGGSGATINVTDEASYYAMLDDGTCFQYSNSVGFGHHPPVDSPQVSQVDSIFSTTLFNSYQWYRNDTALVGETNQSIEATIDGDYHVEITDANNCIAVSKKHNWIKPPTSIKEASLINRIFPNPTSSTIHIQLNGFSQYRIFNNMGIEMQRGSGQALSYDISSWSPGNYIVQVIDEKGTTAKAIIIKQ